MRSGGLLCGALAVLATLVLLRQAVETHRANQTLSERIWILEDDLERKERENAELRRRAEALRSDPHEADRELRKAGRIGEGETLLPAGADE